MISIPRKHHSPNEHAESSTWCYWCHVSSSHKRDQAELRYPWMRPQFLMLLWLLAQDGYPGTRASGHAEAEYGKICLRIQSRVAFENKRLPLEARIARRYKANTCCWRMKCFNVHPVPCMYTSKGFEYKEVLNGRW